VGLYTHPTGWLRPAGFDKLSQRGGLGANHRFAPTGWLR